MTDNEIIKALECCEKGDCYRCPAQKFGGGCTDKAKRLALDLINRQKAEIERLCMELDEVIIAKDLLFDEAEALIKKAKAEAVNEFAERLKATAISNWKTKDGHYLYEISDDFIDNLVKEMVGEEIES